MSDVPPPPPGTPPPPPNGGQWGPPSEAPPYGIPVYGNPPPYGAPPARGRLAAASGGFAPSGYPNGGPPLADYGQRVLAYLIDTAILLVPIVAVVFVAVVLGAVSDALAVLVGVVGGVAMLLYMIWSTIVRQGRTGQTVGKAVIGISLVGEATGRPLGAGMTFVRYLIASALNSLCGLYVFVDLLFPLWDPKHQRLTDKMLNNLVVKSQSVPFAAAANPFGGG